MSSSWIIIKHGLETYRLSLEVLSDLYCILEDYFQIPRSLQTFIHEGQQRYFLHYGNSYVLVMARPYRFSVYNLKGDLEYYDLYTNSCVHDLKQVLHDKHSNYQAIIMLDDEPGSPSQFLLHKTIRYVLMPLPFGAFCNNYGFLRLWDSVGRIHYS